MNTNLLIVQALATSNSSRFHDFSHAKPPDTTEFHQEKKVMNISNRPVKDYVSTHIYVSSSPATSFLVAITARTPSYWVQHLFHSSPNQQQQQQQQRNNCVPCSIYRRSLARPPINTRKFFLLASKRRRDLDTPGRALRLKLGIGMLDWVFFRGSNIGPDEKERTKR